jgi:hypothetical protein
MKTTVLGVVSIVATVSGAAVKLINGQPVDFMSISAAVAAGFGLIKAADSKKK